MALRLRSGAPALIFAGFTIAAGVVFFLLRQTPSGDAAPPGSSATATTSPRPEKRNEPDREPFTAQAEHARIAGPEALAAVLARWCAVDPAAAERWVLALPDETRERPLSDLLAELAREDPAVALRLAPHFTDPARRGEALGTGLAGLAATDSQTAFAQLATTAAAETEPCRLALETRLLPALAEADPAATARWLAEGKALPQTTLPAVLATVQRWAQSDPAAAAQWVAAFEEPQLQRDTLAPLLARWTASDATAAAAWIDSLPAGTTRQLATAHYAAALARTDPQAAETWVARISDPQLAAEARQQIRTTKDAD